MPTYEYECTKCGHVIEMFQSITAKPKRKPDEPCPGCGERAPIRRLIGGGGAVIFKGSGFYETDYRSESYKKAAKAESESTKPKTDGNKDKGGESPAAKPDAAPKKSKEGSGGGSKGKLSKSGT